MPTLDELKETRKQIQQLFAVIMQGTYKGEIVEAVGQAKKFVDGMYVGVQADIDKLEADKPTFTEALKAEIAESQLESDKQSATEQSTVVA